MKARLLLWGVFLSLFVSASQAQDASPTDELETAPPAASDSISTFSLSEMFEDPDWGWYLATCVDLYLVQTDTVLSEDAYESPYAFFGSPEVQAITPGEMWVWLDENFAMDAANLAVTFDAWRSRAAIPAIDPAANEQALDPSTDVNNQPNQIALPAEAPCQCGTNATAALGRTLDWIGTAYSTWSAAEKWSACNAIYDITSIEQLRNAWDILLLAEKGVVDPNKPLTPCARTVTFSGKCYYAGAVNYAMWGRINKLCWTSYSWTSNLIPIGLPTLPGVNDKWSLPYASIAVGGWKLGVYSQFGPEELQALAFTTYGYAGILPTEGLDHCEPNSQIFRNFAFQWRWLPVRNPDNQFVRE